jgi:propanediol dehydratase small subunit
MNSPTFDTARVAPSNDRVMKVYEVAAVRPSRTTKCDLVAVGSQHVVNEYVGDVLAAKPTCELDGLFVAQ